MISHTDRSRDPSRNRSRALVKNIVLDTNVLVSGLLSPDNPPGQIIDRLRRERIQLTLDDRIFAEYSKVVWRPKFDRFNHPEEREWILDYILCLSERLE